MPAPVKTAVFPVAGLGTRFLPATKAIPKEMLTVVDKPLIQYAFEQAVAAGIEHFIFITGRNKEAIINHFDHVYELEETLRVKGKDDLLAASRDWVPPAGEIAFVRQQEPKGLGHAVYCARHFISGPFAVILPDELFLSKTPLLKQMVEHYEKVGGNILGVADVPKEHTSKYGIIDPSSDDGTLVGVKGMVEKPSPKQAPSTISITGQYILQPEIFDHLEKGSAGAGGEIQLTDSMQAMIASTPTYGVRFKGKRYDCGSRRGFLQANIAFALANDDLHDDTHKILKDFLNDIDSFKALNY